MGERYDPRVSNLPPPPSPSPAPPPWPIQPTMARRPSRSLAIASLAVALLALGVAIGSWFRPLPDDKPPPASPSPSFSDQQISDAKARVCATYQKVHQAVLVNTGRSGGSDPIALLGVAANARIALYDGGQYLMKTLADQPATPPDLAAAVRQLVDSWQLLAINYLAEAPQSEVDSSLHAGDQPNATIYGTCK
jgi:hypothetical protein